MEHCEAGRGDTAEGGREPEVLELQAADLLPMEDPLPPGLRALPNARPDAIPVHVPSETTRVWHGTHAERALSASADELPVVDVPVARASEQTMIIRRPVRRKRIDWHAPIGLAASSVVLVVMLAVAEWSERHPVIPPGLPAAPVSAKSEAARPLDEAGSQPIVEALADGEAPRDNAAVPPAERAGRAGGRASTSSALARGDAGRPATKTRTRPSGTRGTRVPPASNNRHPTKDDDAASSGAGSALARSTRARSSRSTGLTSSAWVDPFAAY